MPLLLSTGIFYGWVKEDPWPLVTELSDHKIDISLLKATERQGTEVPKAKQNFLQRDIWNLLQPKKRQLILNVFLCSWHFTDTI